MKQLVFFPLFLAALTLVIEHTPAFADRWNSDAAHTCQQGGWQDLRRADGSSFTNAGDCASYAAQGGVLVSPPSCVTDRYPVTGGSDIASASCTGLLPGSELTLIQGYRFRGALVGPDGFATVFLRSDCHEPTLVYGTPADGERSLLATIPILSPRSILCTSDA